MSRPFRRLLPLLALALAATGCSTIYSDMYSPRRSRFVPPAPKSTVKIEDIETKKADGAGPNAGAAPAADPLGLPPAAGVPGLPADPAAGGAMAPAPAAPAPAIPGL